MVCVCSQYNAVCLQNVKIHEFLQFNEENWKNRELYVKIADFDTSKFPRRINEQLLKNSVP